VRAQLILAAVALSIVQGHGFAQAPDAKREDKDPRPHTFLVRKRQLPNSRRGVQPRFSPDGNEILFRSRAEGGSFVVQHVTDPNRRRTLEPTGHFERYFDWSPNGRRIVFSSYGGGRPQQLYVAPIDSTATPTLIGAAGNAWHPRWSADGREILFRRIMPNRKPAVQILTVATGQMRSVPCFDGWPPGTVARVMWPNWSPDGGRIAYALGRATRPVTSEIFVAPIDRPDSHRQLTHHGEFARSPCFSHDSTRVAYVTCVGAQGKLYVAEAHAASEPVLIDSFSMTYTPCPAWSPVRDQIAINGSDGCIWVFELGRGDRPKP